MYSQIGWATLAMLFLHVPQNTILLNNKFAPVKMDNPFGNREFDIL